MDRRDFPAITRTRPSVSRKRGDARRRRPLSACPPSPECRPAWWPPRRVRAIPARRGCPRRRRAGGWRRSAAGCAVRRRQLPERTAASRRIPHAPCRVSRPPRALRNTAGLCLRAGPGGEGGAAPDQVGVQGPDGVAADGDVALLAALAGEQDGRVLRQVSRSSTSRPVASEIRAPVPYRNSSSARSRSTRGSGSSVDPAASRSRSTASSEMALGSRLAGRAARPRGPGRCAASPSLSANACSPRTATTARPTELTASGGCSSSPVRSAARNSATSSPVTSARAALPRPPRKSAYRRRSRS